MSSTTPQIVRSILRSIPRKFIQPKTTLSAALVSTQCHSRQFSAWSGTGSSHPRLPLARKRQWTRQWSASETSRVPADKDKPNEAFYMPPPSSHTEERAPGSIFMPPPPEQAGKTSDSIAMPPPPPAEQTEKLSDSIPDLPPTRPYMVDETPDAKEPEQSNTTTDPIHTPAPKAKDSRPASTQQQLPSDSEKERWRLSKNTQKFMDDFLAKAAIFSQQLNTYTGTDYSGIEALRREIIEQEREVKAKHAAIAVTKEAYQQAYAAQSSSQKEVVGLLERKHSWSASDLERYMSLIRSEHLNEQSVQRAKDELASAERSLEDARSTLERKERKQYHEEQIWSDTIRRNSTWVTFGLMGLNILLLLSNLAIIEPWRRRRLVKEVRSALEENALATTAHINAAAGTTLAKNVVEEQVDEVVEPAGAKIEEVEKEVAEKVPETVTEPIQEAVEGAEAVGETALAAGEVLPEEAVDVLPQEAAEVVPEPVSEVISAVTPEEVAPKLEPRTWQELVEEKWELYKKLFQDMFSERQVTIKKVDMTAVALESAAAGVAFMGILVLLFNPR